MPPHATVELASEEIVAHGGDEYFRLNATADYQNKTHKTGLERCRTSPRSGKKPSLLPPSPPSGSRRISDLLMVEKLSLQNLSRYGWTA